MKLPMMRPSIRVARRSFFRAIRFLSFSASCSGVSLGGDGIGACSSAAATGRTGLAAADAADDVDATMLAVADGVFLTHPLEDARELPDDLLRAGDLPG